MLSIYPAGQFLCVALFLTLTRTNAADVSVTIPLSVPSGVPIISPSYVSLSIEQDRWTDWVGKTSQNKFFYNTLENLAGLSGAPPNIRIGADSEDHTDFDPNVEFSQAVFPSPTKDKAYPEASSIVVGDGFYQAVQYLPDHTHVTWGVGLGKDNLTSAYLNTNSIIKAFNSTSVKNASITLDYIEIGNEADLYTNNGLRAKSTNFDVKQYVQDWVRFATNITKTAQLTKSSATKFWIGSFAESTHKSSGFSPEAVLATDDVLTAEPGPMISTVSQHHYSGSFCTGNGGLLQTLMEKASIRKNLDQFSPDIAAAQKSNLDYILGETNSYACHGAPGVSNAAGAALWTLDYALFGYTLGITHMYFHQGIGYKYNFIQPVELSRSTLDGSPLDPPLAPHVQPGYYGAIIAAECIGKSGTTQGVELKIENDHIAGYAFFEHGRLARAVFINSEAYLKGAAGERSTEHLALSLPSAARRRRGTAGLMPETFTLKRLSIEHADDGSGLTWGGQSYETVDGKVAGTVTTETGSLSKGLDIAATEVVLLSFL